MTKFQRLYAIINQKNHAIERARERYGIEIDGETYDKLNNMIKNGHYTLLRKTSLTRRKLYLNYNGQEFIIGWDKGKKQIATFIPMSDVYREVIARKRQNHLLLKARQEQNYRKKYEV